VPADWRAVARYALLAATAALGVAGCDRILGPPPEFLQACSDVRALVAQGTSVTEATVDRPQEFAKELRTLSADLRTLAGTIKDEPLRAAVIELAGSYQSTADLTTESRAPSAEAVRRSAARVDDVCNSR
jgi:hypothetical protein